MAFIRAFCGSFFGGLDFVNDFGFGGGGVLGGEGERVLEGG